MNGIKYGVWLFMLFALAACSGGSSDSGSPNAPASNNLEIGRTQAGYIDTDDDVDIYRITANETNRYMLVHCAESTSGSGVDLLVKVYEEVDGNRRLIFGKHKPQGASLSADLDLWIYINQPKNLVIEVRDFMADDHNTDIPYNLTCSYQDSVNGNHDFSNARELSIGPDGALADNISKGGEVDCFTFAPQADGVYTLNVDHAKPGGGSEVELAVSLYDRNGNRILRVTDPNHTIFAYLETAGGPYNVSVEDSDSMHGDEAATYEISVVAADGVAQDNNNVVDNADRIDPDSEGVYTAEGAIDYGCSSVSPDLAGDRDWYSVIVGTEGGATTYHPIELTIADSAADDSTANLMVTVLDSDMESVTYYEYKAGDPSYTNQIRVENGEYFIRVEPAGASQLTQSTAYQVQLRTVNIDDAREVTDRNVADTALDLPSGSSDTGYVSYLSDVDFYSVTVNTSTAKILSIDLTSDTSNIDYQVSIWRGDRMIKAVADIDGSDGPTHLKTSILVPAENPSGDATYHVRVADAQNNEGSAVSYTVSSDVSAVQGAPGHIGQTTGSTLHYYDEVNVDEEIIYNNEFEITEENERLRLEIFSTDRPFFKFNSDWFDFRAHTEYQAVQPDGTTVITLPWISGYVDFQDDRDFLALDFDKLDPAGTETTWHYEVEAQIVAAASDVEYVWKLYRDRNTNGIVMDNPTAPDGYVACAGDTTPQTVDALNLVTPTGDDTFWIGNEMGAGARFYVGISDFNYLMIPDPAGNGADLGENPQTDVDWGYDAPYYFRMILTYHPGESRPSTD